MTDCDADHPEPGAHQHEHHGAVDEHGHGVTANSDSRYITIALGLIVGFLVFEVIMAFVGHSLALLADAGHMLTDAGALGASLLAIQLARRPATGVWTFGFKRAEVLSAVLRWPIGAHDWAPIGQRNTASRRPSTPGRGPAGTASRRRGS